MICAYSLRSIGTSIRPPLCVAAVIARANAS